MVRNFTPKKLPNVHPKALNLCYSISVFLCVLAVQLHWLFLVTGDWQLVTHLMNLFSTPSVSFSVSSVPLWLMVLHLYCISRASLPHTRRAMHKLHSGSHDRATRGAQRLRTCFPPANDDIAAVPAELPATHRSGYSATTDTNKKRHSHEYLSGVDRFKKMIANSQPITSRRVFLISSG